MGDQQCPRCECTKIIKGGTQTLADGSLKQRYKCKSCGTSFPSKYHRLPVQSADENCPYCGSSRTLKKGKPLKQKHGQVQPYICKKCRRKFSLDKKKKRLVYLNGEIIHRYWDPPGLQHVPNISCPNCKQQKAVLKIEYCLRKSAKNKQKNIRKMVCLNCGQNFSGEGRDWPTETYRALGKKVPQRTWRFEDNQWDLRELYPHIEEHKLRQVFLYLDKCGNDWYRNLVKKYLLWRIESGIKPTTLRTVFNKLSSFGKFLKRKRIVSMEGINRWLLSSYWAQDRGHICRDAVHHEMSTLRSFLEWGNNEKYFITSPTLITSFDRPKVFHDEPDPLEESVLEVIRDNLHIIPPPLQLMFMLGFWLGTRPNELCHIPLDSIQLDLDGCTWWIEFKREKIEDEHRLPITTDLVRLIQQQQSYIAGLYGESYPYLFCHYRGLIKTGFPNYPKLQAVKRPPMIDALHNPMVKTIRHLIEHFEIKDSNGRLAKFTGRILRPTRATHLIRDGFSLEFIRIWLKHQEIKTTKRHYTLYPPGELLDVATVMANVDKKYYPYDSNPESLRQHPELHELDGLTMLNGEPLYGYCSFRDFCPRFGRCYTCGYHIAAANKLEDYKSQLERLRTKRQVAFNYDSSEILDSYQEVTNALEDIVSALESVNEEE